MSIQSSISQALGAVEQTLLRAGALSNSKPEETEPEAPKAATAAPQAAPAAKPETPKEAAEEQTAENGATQAATNPLSQIMQQERVMADTYADARLQNKIENLKRERDNARARIDQLRNKGKSPGSRAVRTAKKQFQMANKNLRKEGADA